MGVIKNWRKVNKNLWRNMDKRLAVRVDYSPRGIALTPYVFTTMYKGEITKVRYFKTKNKALKVARNYMRRNP